MSSPCRLCLEAEYPEESLEAHLVEKHGRDPAAVRAVYPDVSERAFDDADEPGDDRVV